MKQFFTIVFLLFSFSIFAQQAGWNASLEPQKVFIENKGQFDRFLQVEKKKFTTGLSEILYATEDGPFQVLFTNDGLIYRLEKKERHSEDKLKRKNGKSYLEMEMEERETKFKSDVVVMKWKNANASHRVIAKNEASHKFYYKGEVHSLEAAACHKIVYTGLYYGIDVEYIFHPEKGIEYNFILQPGADPSQIEMEYSGMSRIYLDDKKNVRLKTIFGDIIDHAPLTFYQDSRSEIPSSFSLDRKSVKFELGNYDASRKIVVDPWTVNPPMGNANRVFHIEADSLGNAYIYGGDSPFKLQKYNQAGALQWTFTNGWDSSTYWFGALIVDRAGNAYITAGSTAEITKVNTGGSQVWTNSGGFVDEYWSMAFNCDETELLVGGTRLVGLFFITGSGRAYNINLNNGSVLNSIKVADAIPAFIINDPNEIRSVCASPNGNYYFLTLDTIGSLVPGISSVNWSGVSGYRFGYGSPDYGFTPQGQSIICATATHIFTCNGDSVVKRDISNGNIIAGAPIPGGGHSTTILVPGTLPRNGGIAIDSCGNIYVGSQGNVSVFDDNLNFIASTPAPADVYDVAIGVNGEVLVCGDAFAASLSMSACGQIHLSCSTLPAAAFSAPNNICPGTCTDFTNLSVNATSYQWYFPGGSPSSSTDVNPASVCYNTPGTYDVTLIASNAGDSDSVTLAGYITVFPYSPSQSIQQSGDTLISNTGFVAYQWFYLGDTIAGATDYYYVAILDGDYSVVCLDSNGCSVEAVALDVITSIQEGEIRGSLQLTLYPNPAEKQLFIHVAQIAGTGIDLNNIHAVLYNEIGERVIMLPLNAEGESVKNTVDVSQLSSGIYLVKIMSDKEIIRATFVKQ